MMMTFFQYKGKQPRDGNACTDLDGDDWGCITAGIPLWIVELHVLIH